MPSSPEITAAAKVLNQDHDGLTTRGVAKLVLEAAEAARDKGAKFLAVGQYSLPDTPLNHVAIGPFSTELQARKAGEGLAWDSKSGTGNGRFMVVPVVAKALDAWNLIRPPAKDKNAWLNEAHGRGIYGETYFEGRKNW